MNSEADGLLIIGYGSSLRGDDDAGPQVARQLRRRGFSAIETHQLTPELAQEISSARVALFVDADAAVEPGRIRVGTVPDSSSSPFDHQVSPSSLVQLTRELYGRAPAALLLAIGGACYEVGAGLSTPVRRAVRGAVDGVASAARTVFDFRRR
jgi:hydrogenase maturation protease